jgi:hypothetical protein
MGQNTLKLKGPSAQIRAAYERYPWIRIGRGIESYTVWRTASLRSAPHQQTPDPVYIVVDKLVHCDPNMYS